jgi:co-chaperonin GroES (HSP10)
MVDLIAPEGKIILEQYIQQTPSGMDMPEKSGEPRVGIVYAFGEPKKDDPKVDLKKGQKVVIKKYVSSPLFVAELGKSFIFVDYDDVTAILKEGKSE